MKETLEILSKWGVTGGCVIALFWFNGRLNNVETKLYDCWEERIERNDLRKDNPPYVLPERAVAILPNEIKIKRDESKV